MPLHDASFPVAGGPFGASVALYEACVTQLTSAPDPNHWRGLAGAMWSEEPAIQVLAARMLLRLSEHDWA
jgi:protein PhnA